MTEKPTKPRFDGKWALLAAIAISLLVIASLFLNDVQAILAWMEGQGQKPWAPIIAVLIFVVGSYILVPQWILIGAAITTFGFLGGAGISWIGTMISVLTHLALARPFGDRIRARYTGAGLRRLMAMFSENSLKSGFIVRLIPTGPALLVNSAAGLAGVKRGRFLIGTAVGIIPKILLTGFVAQGAISLADGEQIALWIMLAALFGLAQFILIQYLKQSRNRKDSEK